MSSLEDFRKRLQGDDDQKQQAMKDYVINVDALSLDGDTEKLQACREQEVTFEFKEPNIILMRAKLQTDSECQKIWYLPWLTSGASKAVLGPDGPAYFSTSQLDGCRFTIKYDDKSRKKVTVLHLSGRLGMSNKISVKRNEKEIEEFGDLPKGPLVRRYSSATIGRYGKGREQKKMEALANHETLLYNGNKAFIWGFRNKNGAWNFMANEMDYHWKTGDTGLGYIPLT